MVQVPIHGFEMKKINVSSLDWHALHIMSYKNIKVNKLQDMNL